jgi:glycosyltransferase involved in cell wall biosynthesis
MTRILLATSWGNACGIAEHSAYLVANLSMEFNVLPSAEALDPQWVHHHYVREHSVPPILHLNYHRALHSRWTPQAVEVAKRLLGSKIVITFHDTREQADDLMFQLLAHADAFIVHEPVEWKAPSINLENTGLYHYETWDRVHYWRQGVPDWPIVTSRPVDHFWKYRQPVVGTVGFPFPWKNYDLLCQAAAEAGWGVLLLAPNATPEDIQRWQTLNPATHVIPTFTPREQVVEYLASCDATAFLYTCANTGTSGAIRQGLAARKPVIATKGCRQFRDLVRGWAINWTDATLADVRDTLSCMSLSRVDPSVVRQAHEDSWTIQGQRYATLYQQLLEAI